jgi:acetyl esterase/lipase
MGLALAITLVGLGAAGAWLLRERPSEELNVVYGKANGEPLRLDIYRPPGRKVRPAVLLIHGGGWVSGDKSSQRDLAEGMTRLGYVAIAVGYRLALDDTSRYPAPIDDVRRAVRWVRAHAGSLGVDPDRIGAFGHSAGGHLAAMLGTTDALGTGEPDLRAVSSRVQCVVDCCGPTDFTDESSPPVGPSIAWMVPNLFGKTRQEAPEAYQDASPAIHADARSAPTLILHGNADEIVPIAQSRRLRDALAQAGAEVTLIELDGGGHHFLDPKGGDRASLAAAAFLRRHLRP